MLFRRKGVDLHAPVSQFAKCHIPVNLGGDADTIGAVYGQIAGAFYGYDAIPERWLAAVKDRECVDSLIEDMIEAKEAVTMSAVRPKE